MISTKFILKEPNKDCSLIYMYIFAGQKKPFKYPIAEVVPVKYWKKKDYIDKEILERYDYKLPKQSEPKLNEFIKEVGELAGMNEPIIVTKTEGGEKVTRTFKKYELITSHTARRSGATNMYLSGYHLFKL
ncbi:MAG: hypothetical protein A2X18_12790 [Bacteroidetes bacterium GWF2_40_14]|nr:MAG: hypothetical protein A2X18_12790 [Bacteroidetes bacterium GWF2_40_14]